jgi:phenylacetic acid degradation operon negative regulatory protein
MSPERNEPLLRPLTPRSVIASLLLGIHPPRLPGALLARWCGLLGIAEGTTRVALSRMVDAGELTIADGRYELAGRLRARQAGQDWALTPVLLPWTGDWDLWVVRPGGRDAARRSSLRRAAAAARLVEVRDGVWGRPANLPPDATPPDAHAVLVAQAERWTARPEVAPAVDAAFALLTHATRSRQLLDELRPVTAALAGGDLARLPEAFSLGAATLQHVHRDPLLPPALTGIEWPGAALRTAYVDYQAAFADAAGAWFAQAGPTGRARPGGAAHARSAHHHAP